ncbi:hypothetical protein [Mongoliibacter ruber]|uniref:PorZ N-terminal beta-propeller domain-containing protein n=1 Tax=Mongoliibacter ruber TaxID=1750599 RepID=A0A2T0WSC1_9BACT|nr:hypothetical protein [Mongoliibacter ruber]PRY89592.1 hypothetical protein CLW00_10268 [Mongoliibacter ruber]
MVKSCQVGCCLFFDNCRFWALALISTLTCQFSFSQSNIPVGTWQIHNSYLDSGILTGSETSIFSITGNAVFYLNVNTREVNTLTVLDGLYDQNFTTGTFAPNSKKLILSYPDGSIQLIGEREISTITPLRDNPQINQKRINSIKVKGNLALLSGAFGMAVLNVGNETFEASFTNLGKNGDALEIFDLTEDPSRYYLATANGLLIGNKSRNLNDFRNWERVAETGNSLIETETIGSQVFTIDEKGTLSLFNRETFELENIIGISKAKNLHFFGERLFFQMDNSVYSINENGSWNLYYNNEAQNIFSDYFISNSGFFLQIKGEGIVTGDGSTFSPNAPLAQIKNFLPSREGSFAIPYFQNLQGEIKLANRQILSRLFQGRWEKLVSPEEILTIAQIGFDIYFGTNTGLWKKTGNNLIGVTLPGLQDQPSVSSLHVDQNANLWIGLGNGDSKLYKLTLRGELEQVNVPGLAIPYKIISDRASNLWILQRNQSGNSSLQVFNENSGLNRMIGTVNSTGGLANANLLDIDIDYNQRVWIGTENGVAYIPNANTISNSSTVNTIVPNYLGRPLLAGVIVSQVKTAPDQTKWFGTENEGIWRFSEFGDELIEQFGRNNSPLVSNRVENLNLDPSSGELLIVQENASFSYRTSAIESYASLEELKIFPNPVRPEFNGLLSIEGLTDFAQVKVTTSAGRVVYSAEIRGGKATWNLLALQGGRVQPGVYLVWVMDESGKERVSGKFVVL